MFRGPSWETLYRVPLRSPPASPPKRLAVRSRVARQEDSSSGASSRLAPSRTRKFFPLPAGGDRSFCLLPRPSCRCRPSGEAGTSVPITWSVCTSPPSRGSEIFGNWPVDNGDFGNNIRNIPGFPDSRSNARLGLAPELPFRSPPPTSIACQNPRSPLPSPRICRA